MCLHSTQNTIWLWHICCKCEQQQEKKRKRKQQTKKQKKNKGEKETFAWWQIYFAINANLTQFTDEICIRNVNPNNYISSDSFSLVSFFFLSICILYHFNVEQRNAHWSRI